MARSAVREVSRPEGIQAVAAPVSTYVRPADPGRNGLADIADGLAAFDQGLQSFLNQRAAQGKEDDKARAITDFHRNNQVSYAEAVRKGLIPATASRAYMEWYKRSQGEVAGLKLQSQFDLDYQQWEGRNSADEAGYQTWATQWMHDNIGDEQDPDILKGLAPRLDQMSLNGLGTFMKERDARVKEGARATTGAIITDALVKASDGGKVGEEIDQDALWNRMMQLRTEAVTPGNSTEDYDSWMVSSVLLQAEKSHDKGLLKVLDHTLPGQEHPMSYDPEVRKKIDASSDRIDSRLASMSTTEYTLQERKDKAEHQEFWTEAVDLLSNGKEVPEELIQKLSRRDGQARKKIAEFKHQYQGWEADEDPQSMLHVYSEIYNGAGKDFVLKQMKLGVIRKGETFDKAMKLVDQVNKASGDDGILSSPTFKQYSKFILNETSDGVLDPFGNSKLTAEGMEADYDLRRMTLQWSVENPGAGVLEREKALKEIGETIKSRLVGEDTGSGKQYLSDADIAKQNAEKSKAQEEANKAAAEKNAQAEIEGQPTEQPPTGDGSGYSIGDTLKDRFVDGAPTLSGTLRKIFGDQAMDDFWRIPTREEVHKAFNLESAWPDHSGDAPADNVQTLESLPEDRRGAVEEFAKRKGISPEEANTILQGRVQKMMGDQGVDPTVTNSIPQESRDKLSTLLQDPPKVERLAASNVPVAPILSLIGHTEGTDRGNGYNETLGYGAYTGGDVDLVNMTLGQVDQLQTQMLRHPDNKWDSSAVGRYQIIRTTMRDLKKEMGLTDDMKFDKRLQDRMAMQLLKKRGLDDWQAGKLSDDQFMDNLAHEWASLPKADGRGAYKGQRTGVSPGGVRQTLNKVKGVQVASLDPSIGLPKADPYANIPDVDASGNAGQREKFREWNSDPVGNNEANLKSLKPQLADVVRKAQEASGVKFVVGAGKRDAALQKKAVEWGWSKTEDSDHLDGGAVDLWPIDSSGAVAFTKKEQLAIVKAMKSAAKELGVKLDIGADWKRFKDLPHFALKS